MAAACRGPTAAQTFNTATRRQCQDPLLSCNSFQLTLLLIFEKVSEIQKCSSCALSGPSPSAALDVLQVTRRVPGANAFFAFGAAPARPGHILGLAALFHDALELRVGGYQLAHGAAGALGRVDHLETVSTRRAANDLQVNQKKTHE